LKTRIAVIAAGVATIKGNEMGWIIGKIGKLFVGHRTRIGGVGAILMGVIGAINMLWPDTVPGMEPMTTTEIGAWFTGGFAALGIGGKVDKNTEAVKNGNATLAEKPAVIVTPELTDEQRELITR